MRRVADVTDSVQVRFIADPTAEFTKKLDLGFDGQAAFGGIRSKRYALKIANGKVVETHIEPDGTGADGRTPPLHPLDPRSRN